MTLDDAIKHCEERVKANAHIATTTDDPKFKEDCIKCAKDHAQLAEWLKELKIRRELDCE